METPPPQPPQEPVPPQPIPPQNPAPPEPTAPVAQPAAPQPTPGVAYVPPSGPSIRFDAISQAFNMIFADAGTWIVAALLVLIPVIAINIVFGVLMIGAWASGAGIIARMLQVLASGVGLFVGYILMANMFRMAIKALSGERPNVNDMFKFDSDMSNIVTAALVLGLGTGIGLGLFIIPGLIFGGLTMFALPLVVDQKMPAMDAISRSISLLQKEIVMAAIFFLVAMLCGWIPLGLLIAVYPISVAILYRDYVGFANAPAVEAAPAP